MHCLRNCWCFSYQSRGCELDSKLDRLEKHILIDELKQDPSNTIEVSINKDGIIESLFFMLGCQKEWMKYLLCQFLVTFFVVTNQQVLGKKIS